MERKLDIVSFKTALVLAAGWAVGELSYSYVFRPLLATTKLITFID